METGVKIKSSFSISRLDLHIVKVAQIYGKMLKFWFYCVIMVRINVLFCLCDIYLLYRSGLL